MYIQKEPALTFDDVVLKPRYSDIPHRSNEYIDTSVEIVPGIKIRYPIILANMPSIANVNSVIDITEAGGLGILHRFSPIDEHISDLLLLKLELNMPNILTIGVGKDIDRLNIYINEIGIPDAVLIDVAHAHHKLVAQQIETIKKIYSGPIIVGNISTAEAARFLCKLDIDAIKINQGAGSICLTRTKTGCGYPQLSAIIEISEVVKGWNSNHHDKPITLIADGGLSNYGDVVKSLAAGADAVMTGKLFADCNGNTIYSGSTSPEVKKEVALPVRNIEGGTICFSGTSVSIAERMEEIMDGVRSGFSYLGATNITELRDNAVFIKQSYNGYKEGLLNKGNS